MERTVKVTGVNMNNLKPKRNGEMYECASIYYTGKDGNTVDISVAKSFLIKNEKLMAEMSGVKTGDTITLQLEKNGLYTNLIGIGPSDGTAAPSSRPQRTTPSSSGGSPARGSFADNAVGAQVGNALNNAALLLAHGVKKGKLKDVAIEILTLGEELKGLVSSGALTKVNGAANKAGESSEVVLDSEDITYGDD